MHHIPSSKSYVGMSYHGVMERMKTHRRARNRDPDPCHRLMRGSASPFEWIMWPMERFGMKRTGFQEFHKKAAPQEGWWADKQQSWWPRGLIVASTGHAHNPVTRAPWNTFRGMQVKQMMRERSNMREESRKQVNEIGKTLRSEGTNGINKYANLERETKRGIMQFLGEDTRAGEEWRNTIERRFRRDLSKVRERKEKPKGEFVKIRITNKAWNLIRVRQILREENVVQLHPDPEQAKLIWVGERNLPRSARG